MAGNAVAGHLTPRVSLVRRATADDDAGIRALLRRSVLPGAVRVAFTRDPSYALGEGLAGAVDATVVAHAHERVAAMGKCSTQTLMRNGIATPVGYLGELRLDPDTPASPRVLRDGYRLMHEALQAAGARACFTSITSDNARARQVLEHGGRLGLPIYAPLCDLVTLVLPVRHGAAGARAAELVSAEDCAVFLRAHAARCQLALAWTPEQCEALMRHGADLRDACVVRRHGRMVGVAHVWDQRAFRQIRIDGYSRPLDLARGSVNMVQRLRGLPTLPAAGAVLAQGMLFGAAVESPDEWPALWTAVQVRAAALGLEWLAIARDARDPELATLRALAPAQEYHTTLYDVAWRSDPATTSWDARLFRPEAALL